jgi:hypothetical protein
MSIWAQAMVAATRAVSTPVQAISSGTQVSAAARNGLIRHIR